MDAASPSRVEAANGSAAAAKPWTWRSGAASAPYVVACLVSSALAFAPLLTLLLLVESVGEMLLGAPLVVPGPPPFGPVLLMAVGWLLVTMVALLPAVIVFLVLRERLPFGRWWALGLGLAIVIVPSAADLIAPTSPLSIWRVVFWDGLLR